MIQLDPEHLKLAQEAANCVHRDVCLRDIYALQLIQAPITRVLDIGAHIGVTSMACRTLWPNAEIICVEPPTGNLPTLIQMIEDQNIKLLPVPFGPDGTEMFHAGTNEYTQVTGAHGFMPSAMWVDSLVFKSKDGSVLVEGKPTVGTIGRSLATLLAKFKTSEPGLLVKIDCECGEWSMIRDPQSDDAIRMADYLTMEVHTFGGSLRGVTWEEVAGWANRFSNTHSVLMPSREASSPAGFIMGFLRQGFLPDDLLGRLKRHYEEQVNGEPLPLEMENAL